MKITILTLFPQMFQGPFDASIVKIAREKKLVDISFVNIRDFGLGRHKVVDDTPYGGGHGMVLRVDVLKKAIDYTKIKTLSAKEEKVILTSARGKTYTQKVAKDFSKFKHLIIVCGHYEGVDERINRYIDEEISVGDFVLTGGEIPAILITDSITRLIPGVLKEGVTERESFSDTMLEYPQYTKPQSFENVSVPEVLLSGNHEKIRTWREGASLKKTHRQRPDLLKK